MEGTVRRPARCAHLAGRLRSFLCLASGRKDSTAARPGLLT